MDWIETSSGFLTTKCGMFLLIPDYISCQGLGAHDKVSSKWVTYKN